MSILIEDIRIKRGTASAVSTATLLKGELAAALDTRQLWIGDGTNKIALTDIVMASDYASLPLSGEQNKLYIVKTDENNDNDTTMYIYTGTAYKLASAPGTIEAADVTDLDTYLDNRITNNWQGQVNGLASLGGDGKIPSSQLPALSLSEVHVVADITARDALTVQEGDMAIVSSNGKSYIYDGTSWVELTASGTVTSVNGATGAVTLDTGDINEGGSNLYFTESRARSAVLLDTATATTTGWSSSKINTEVGAAKQYLGTRIVTENSGAVDDGKVIAYNDISGNLEYHQIVVDGGDL